MFTFSTLTRLIFTEINFCESRNINEVIRAVVNFYFFTKRFRTHQKHQKAPKAPKTPKSTKKPKKHQKAQKRNQAKVQNANKRTKIKNALEKHLRGKK